MPYALMKHYLRHWLGQLAFYRKKRGEVGGRSLANTFHALTSDYNVHVTHDRTEINKQTRQIGDQFSTILFEADANATKFYAPTKVRGLESLEARLDDRNTPEDLVVSDPSVWELHDERVKLLGKLYLSLDKIGRGTILFIAQNGLAKKSHYAKYSAYLFTFLAKYDNLEKAIDCAVDSLSLDETSLNVLRSVSNLLKYDPGLPSDDLLTSIQSLFLGKWDALKSPALEKRPTAAYTPGASQVAYDRMRTAVMRIVRQAQQIKYRRLRDYLLNDENLEINRDRQTLTTALVKFGFTKELFESLEHAEAEYRKADSNFDFKTSADHNRSFFERLLWETAEKIAKIRSQPLTAQQKSPVQVREYLHKAGFFSDRLHKLGEAFYHFASEQSTHQLASGREIARVVRNINIEIGLLVMHRLDSFK